MVEVECPLCGETCHPTAIETKHRETPIPVARRQTGFGGDITSLHKMNHFAYMAKLPCRCEFITVN